MRQVISFLIVLSLLSSTVSFGFTDESEITVTVVGKNPELETKAKVDFEKLLKKYDVSRYLFTKKVQIEDGVIPHSHPILTLNTRYIDQPLKQLTTFLHEQIHWWVSENDDGVSAAIAEFRKRYPKIPTERREIARNEYSTYLHLVVCYLELIAMRDVAGEKAAAEAFNWLKGHHYRWIYRTVLKDEAEIAEVVKRHGLMLPEKK